MSGFCRWYGKDMEDVTEHEQEQCEENGQDCRECPDLVIKEQEAAGHERYNTDQIIGILLRNGEKVPKSIENQLYKRLDALDAQIFECEMEYKEIVTALTGENRRKEHGNRIQRHGRTEQEQQGRS